MPGSQPLIYWDANVFLAYINADPRWLPIVEMLLDKANNWDEISIVTSVLSVTEVAFAAMERAHRALSQAEETRIDSLWTSSEGIIVVDFNEIIARIARDIRRDDMTRGWTGRRTPDIIHLATARYMSVQEMHTIDGGLHRYGSVLGFPVREPHTARLRLPGI